MEESSPEGRYASNKCPCGCNQTVEGRKDKKYFSRFCKDRVRNHLRYEKQKRINQMAIEVLELQGFTITKKGG